MTLDMPQGAAVYVERSPQLRRELNAIVVAVVTMRMRAAAERAERARRSSRTSKGMSAMAKWDQIVKAASGRLDAPYRFSRADAYDEELG